MMQHMESHFYLNFYNDGAISVKAGKNSGYEVDYHETLPLDVSRELVEAIDAVLTPHTKVLEGYRRSAIARRQAERERLRGIIERTQEKLDNLEEE